jgi:hypothetical protein
LFLSSNPSIPYFIQNCSSKGSPSFTQIDSNPFENFRRIAKCHCSFGLAHASWPVLAHETGPPPSRFSPSLFVQCAPDWPPPPPRLCPAAGQAPLPILHAHHTRPPSPPPCGTAIAGPPFLSPLQTKEVTESSTLTLPFLCEVQPPQPPKSFTKGARLLPSSRKPTPR